MNSPKFKKGDKVIVVEVIDDGQNQVGDILTVTMVTEVPTENLIVYDFLESDFGCYEEELEKYADKTIREISDGNYQLEFTIDKNALLNLVGSIGASSYETNNITLNSYYEDVVVDYSEEIDIIFRKLVEFCVEENLLKEKYDDDEILWQTQECSEINQEESL